MEDVFKDNSMRIAFWAIWLAVLGETTLRAEDEFERPPIAYSRSTPENVVSRFQRRLDRNEVELKFDEAFGYLPALLDALQIPRESQMLVFSKTSLQRGRIQPKTPRAIYFNDDVYVGYCHAGNVLEVSAVDPQLGVVFYTLDQTAAAPPNLTRQTDQCLLCHRVRQGSEIPGHLVRSVFTDPGGFPILTEGSFRVDHTTKLKDRWGGWYVTGTHGDQTHLGNLIVRDVPVKRPVANPDGLNVTDLSARFSTTNYLTPHSDLVALMIFEHQTHVQNLITRANHATRQALHYELELNRELKEPLDRKLESTGRRIASAGDELVKGLLLAGEAPLAGPIAGSSDFAALFAKAGPRDPAGRSLRDLDLHHRIFKHPCSYLVYSPAFDGLPPEMKQYVATKLRAILKEDTRQEQPPLGRVDESFAHLSREDRQAIWEILTSTKPDLFEHD